MFAFEIYMQRLAQSIPPQARMEDEQRIAQQNKALRDAAKAAKDRVRAARAAQNAAAIQQAEAAAITAGAAAGEVCLSSSLKMAVFCCSRPLPLSGSHVREGSGVTCRVEDNLSDSVNVSASALQASVIIQVPVVES